jgi:hypothetical protein
MKPNEPTLPFQTTQEELEDLITIVAEMKTAGIDPNFIAKANEIAQTCQGMYDLMFMWADSREQEKENLAAIQEVINDHAKFPLKDK